MVEAWIRPTCRGKARPDSEQSDAMRMWWDWKGIVYEFLPLGKTIDSDLYCQQLMKLKAIEKNQPELVNSNGVVFHHHKVRPHSSIATQQKLRELAYDVLMHPQIFSCV